MTWLNKSDLEIPGDYGRATPFPHWVSPTELHLIFCSQGQIWAWKCAVNAAGQVTGSDTDIRSVGTLHQSGEYINWVEALDGGGYVVHTISPGSE